MPNWAAEQVSELWLTKAEQLVQNPDNIEIKKNNKQGWTREEKYTNEGIGDRD